MECEMEIEDDSLDASGMEEATPPMEPTISVAPPIPVVADLCVDDKGRKVNQALPPTPQEEESSKVEEDEPLPPGVEEEAEPLPPGIDIDSATSSKDMGKASSVSQVPGKGVRVWQHLWHKQLVSAIFYLPPQHLGGLPSA